MNGEAKRNPAELGRQHGHRRRVLADVIVQQFDFPLTKQGCQIESFDEVRGLQQGASQARSRGAQARRAVRRNDSGCEAACQATRGAIEPIPASSTYSVAFWWRRTSSSTSVPTAGRRMENVATSTPSFRN